MKTVIFILFCNSLAAALPPGLAEARDKQDLAAIQAQAAKFGADAQKAANQADAQYLAALVQSYASEVAMEKGDKGGAKRAAEEGIKLAEKAVQLNGSSAEYHRLLGTLCGQIIPANVLAGFKYGKCAMDEVAKSIEMAPKVSENWLSHGVGNYYLPPTFGGGIDLAIKDFEKAIQLNPKSADAHLWLGLALRKSGKNAAARKAIQKSLEINPNRLWAKQQLDKTPAQ